MDEPVSKTQKKREAENLKKIALQFIDLSVSQLDLLPLSESLYKAIIDAKSIKSHGAKRRQGQLIGKLMRSADFEEIIAAYDRLRAEERSVTASFHEVELWRDRLINEGKEALTEFIKCYHPEALQHLRQLIKKAVDDQAQQKNTGAAKALFRHLRSLIV